MNRFISLIPVLCLAVFSACQQEDDLPSGDNNTVTLTLNIGTQSTDVSARATDPNVEPYEGIRTLRALVISYAADPKARKILYNEKHTIDNSTAPKEAKLSAQLKLENIPVGQASIYLIANEESIGTKYTSDKLMSPTYIDDNKLLLLDEGWQHFPKTYEDIAEKGLPMSGKTEGVTISPDTKSFSVTLERAVVKLHLTVENATTGDMTLDWVKYGEFISNRVYMYRTQQLDIPQDTKYKGQRFPQNDNETLNETLPAGQKTKWNSVYIYPNFAYKNPVGSNPYTLALKTDKKEYPPSLIDNNINSMIRNTMVNITARITASASISIGYEYVPWTDVIVNVPPFN